MGFFGMLFFTGACTVVALIIHILFITEEEFDFGKYNLMGDDFSHGPTLEECNFDYSEASYLSRHHHSKMSP